MKLLDLTLPTPAENLALDEALLEQAEQSDQPLEVLRLWEPAAPLAVIGRASRIDDEVNRESCARRGIPIFRRCSGGAAIVAGPGCLMYAVVLSYTARPQLRMIDRAHQFVLATNARALCELGVDVSCRGISDLATGERKISGNSMRCKRTHFLYHGTLLYNFALEIVADCLKTPPRQPEYRRNRPHGEFIANFPAEAQSLRDALIRAWRPAGVLSPWPQELTQQLAAQRYACDAWNFRL